MKIIFALSVFCIFFSYFGYPASLALAALVRRKPVRKAPFEPQVTLIITVCNEERRIAEKLENALQQDYPRQKLQILVASDGSTDATNAIVASYADRGVELAAFAERRGKESAQKDAILKAGGEVIVFSDVATRMDPGGISEIVANFADATVGCVSSADRVIDREGKPCGEGFYVWYEMWLRSLESQVGSLVGLSGSFFAARRQVVQDLSADMQSDFRTVLNSMRLGLRGVIDGKAVGYYEDLSDGKREFDRKVRTVLRGLTVFFHNLDFLNPLRYGFFSYQYFCHKLLRWLVPFFLCTALATNASLAAESLIYRIVLGLQAALYCVAAAACRSKSPAKHALLRIPAYFFTVNVAITVAWWRFATGNRVVMWTPSQR